MKNWQDYATDANTNKLQGDVDTFNQEHTQKIEKSNEEIKSESIKMAKNVLVISILLLILLHIAVSVYGILAEVRMIDLIVATLIIAVCLSVLLAIGIILVKKKILPIAITCIIVLLLVVPVVFFGGFSWVFSCGGPGYSPPGAEICRSIQIPVSVVSLILAAVISYSAATLIVAKKKKRIGKDVS